MNDSNNNNIFGNNNVTPTPQPNDANRVNSTSEMNNSINNVNPTVDVNNVFGINPTTTVQQSEAAQINQSATTIQPQNNLNTQVNNTVSNSNINQAPFNPLSTNNVNVQSTIQQNQNINNNIPPQQNFGTVSQVNDDDLLRAFIGNNYEKITTRPFNFAGFFFTSFYMFYRKMFGYALLVFLLNLIVLNVIKIFVVTIAFNVVVGLLVNKIYLFYANKKIAKIKTENPQKSMEELKGICSTTGGTSVGKIFLGFLTELGIAFVILFVMMIVGIGGAISEFLNLDNWNITVNDGSNTNDSPSSTSGTLVEDVSVSGYSCFNSKCNISIEDSTNNTTDYVLSINNSELFNTLGDYKDYIKLNIYYTQKGNEKTIVDYKIFLKSNNEDISNVKTENELRNKIGLFSIGTHTETFTLTEIGTTGFGFKNDTSYTYTSYTFVDSKNIEYEMKYINDNGTLNLVEGNRYKVTFEVAEDTFGYEFTIKSIN